MQITKSVPAVERAIAMLETLDSSTNGLNIADMSRRLGIPRSTAHTIALTLERCGYVTRDASQRHCMLSSKAYHLGRTKVKPERIARAAVGPMRQLSMQTQLTSHLAVLEEAQAVYVQKVQGPSLLQVDTYVGKRTNLHCTAVGKVLLSYAPEGYRNRILARGNYARYTQNTITMPSILRGELERVSIHGYAVDNQEEELDIRCLAVPVFSSRGDMLAALSISGRVEQLKESRIREVIPVMERAAALVVSQMNAVEMSHAS